jgi:hypothetical protein
MMTIPAPAKRVFTGFLFGSSIALISLAIHLNPSQAAPPTPFGTQGYFYLFTILSFIISSAIFILPLLWEQKKFFVIVFSLSLVLQLGMLMSCAVLLHRDFFTTVFQLFLIYPLIFFYRNEILFPGPQESLQVRRMYVISVVFFIMCFIWLMMMGYAITTRQEPRWQESIIYNIYFAILLFLLFLRILNFRSRMFRRVFVTPDTIRIDDYDFTEFLGKVNLNIIRTFMQNHSTSVTCSLLSPCLTDNEQNGNTIKEWECGECLKKESKVSLCPKYRNIYNRILDIKKLFESLEIGTIISPENKMKILTEGWKLRFFDDIRIIDHEVSIF